MSEFEKVSEKSLIAKAITVLKQQGLKAFLKKAMAYTLKRLEFFLLPVALFRIKRLRKDLTIDELLDFAFNELFGLIKPMQVRSEISELLKIVAEIKPKTILEIGTANGGTLFLLSRVAPEDATIISIDLPGGKFGGGYPKWRSLLYKSFALPNQKIYLLRMDSHKEETLEKVRSILRGRKLDFLFIDGDHTYKGVKQDFEMYSKLVQERGVIAFHDIVPGPKECVGGVPEFWKEIKEFHKIKELVECWDQGGYGIGVLYLS